MNTKIDLDLGGTVALVTGAGQGAGAEIARYLAAQGARVAVNDFFPERAAQVAGEIGGYAVPFDVTDYGAVTEAVTKATGDLGPIRVLVNNAGNAGAQPPAASRNPFWDSDPEQWEPWLSVNLDGVLNTCRAALPSMIDAGAGGRIISIISEAGRVGEAGMEIYSAAKAAAAGFTRALAKSVARHGITANTVSIGLTRTPSLSYVTEDTEILQKVLRAYPIRRPGEPSDVAAMVAFLASPAASWITAQNYPVNGGFSVSQ